MITISAFKSVPDFARGQVRDLRVRWALEEVGLPYKTRLLEQGDQDKPEYRALQPFGQVPILEEDGLVLFESGAIVLHIGARSATLLPSDPSARARATQWLVAALNSIEPFVMNVALIDLFYANERWAKLRRPGAVEFVQKRLGALSNYDVAVDNVSTLDSYRTEFQRIMGEGGFDDLMTQIERRDRELASTLGSPTGQPF
jgi:glutathione S-transferase